MKIVEHIKQAGVVGAGGAGFPTHVKYASPAQIVIANGAECEPLLYCDQEIMRLKGQMVVEGLKLAVEAVGAHSGIIALKAKYHEAVSLFRSLVKAQPKLSVFELNNYYPAGDEHVLVNEVTSRVVPEGDIPLKAGIVVSNVGTLVNVVNAREGIPVTERWVTVTGAVAAPVTLCLPLGTPLSQAVALAGGAVTPEAKIIVGGPMMGYVEENWEAPLTKIISGIIVLPASHRLVQKKLRTVSSVLRFGKAACSQCMRCTDLCPRFLLGHRLKPNMIMRAIATGTPDTGVVSGAFLCTECGLCEYYACDQDLSPARVNGYLKSRLSAAGASNPYHNLTPEPLEARMGRRVPTPRLIARLGLKPYLVPAGFKETAFRPAVLRLPLKQHVGAPALPVVKAGQGVKRGQQIAAIPEGKLGANLHAPLDGTVQSVEPEAITLVTSA